VAPNPIAGEHELYAWPEGEYDSEFLGIMQYVLKLEDYDRAKLALI
jgi:hypothetical protein